MQAQMGANDSLAAHPEHCLAFYPPIIIHNVLPFEVEVFLQDHSTATDLERQSWTIPRGESQEVYNFDMVRKLKMHVHLKVDSCTLEHATPHLHHTMCHTNVTPSKLIRL